MPCPSTVHKIIWAGPNNVYPRSSTGMPFLFRKLRFFVVFLIEEKNKKVNFEKCDKNGYTPSGSKWSVLD